MADHAEQAVVTHINTQMTMNPIEDTRTTDTGTVVQPITETEEQQNARLLAGIQNLPETQYEFGAINISLPEIDAFSTYSKSSGLGFAEQDIETVRKMHTVLLGLERAHRICSERAVQDGESAAIVGRAYRIKAIFMRNMLSFHHHEERYNQGDAFDVGEGTIWRFRAPEVPPRPVRQLSRAQRKAEKKRFNASMEKQIDKMKSLNVQYTDQLNVANPVTINSNLLDSKYMKDNVFSKEVSIQRWEGDTLTKVKVTKQSIVDAVRINHDYSQLENLDAHIRFMLAAEYAKNIEFKGSPEEMARRLKNAPHGGIMNPLLRIAISLGMRGALDKVRWERSNFRALDELLCTTLVVKTMTTNPANNPPENVQAQKLMLRTMFMCQLGDIQFKEGGQNRQYTGTVANMFTHCSRVGFSFSGRASEVVGQKQGDDFSSGLLHRTAATHSISRKNRTTGEKFKEIKTKGLGLYKAFMNQYGVNVAAGGFGNKGIPGPDGDRLLTNDGSCGHMYMHVEDGDETHYSGMLVGIESDTPLHINQTGHKHTITAKADSASTFGGQRIDEVGDKYDGRNVEISSCGDNELGLILTELERKYEALRQSGNQADLDKFVSTICGKKMSTANLRQFIENDLGMSLTRVPTFNQNTSV